MNGDVELREDWMDLLAAARGVAGAYEGSLQVLSDGATLRLLLVRTDEETGLHHEEDLDNLSPVITNATWIVEKSSPVRTKRLIMQEVKLVECIEYGRSGTRVDNTSIE